MTLVVGDKGFKSKREFCEIMHPGCEKPTNNQINVFVYHVIPSYKERKKSLNREAYRNRIGRPVRQYQKMCPLASVDDGNSQRNEIIDLLKKLGDTQA